MPTLGSLVVKILGDTSDIKKKLNEYGKKVDQAKTATDNFSNRVQNSFKNFIKFGAIIGGAFLAIRKLTRFLTSSLDAYSKQEEAITKLNAALIATGRYTPMVSKEMQKYAVQMQNLTKFSDDQIESAQGIMATFTKIANDTFPEALEAAMNMSTMFGQDLQQSVVQLGTALNDPILGVGRLRRIGISFTEEQKKLIATLVEQNDLYGAQRVILDELQVEIGGTARAVGKEYAGKVAQLNSAFTDLKEAMGSVMADSMEPMLPLITRLVRKTSDLIEKKQQLRRALKLLAGQLEISSDFKRLEIKENEQIVALEHQNRLEKALTAQKRGEYTAIISAGVNALQNEGETLQQSYDRLRKETRDRANQIEGLQKGIKARKEHEDSVKDEIKTTDDAADAHKELVEQFRKEMDVSDEMTRRWDTYVQVYQNATEANIILSTRMEELNKKAEEGADRWETYRRVFINAWRPETVKVVTDGINKIIQKYDEWAAKAEETVSNITGMMSMGMNAIDNVVNQSFTNRNLELDNWYEAEKDKIYATIENEEERERALEELDHEADQRRRKLARDEAIAGKNMAIINAIINTAQAVTKALSQGGFIFGPAFAAFIGALGAIQIALIKKQPLPALAEGGEFVTSGPQIIMVGDNPGGRELVQATPLSSPNTNGPAREITFNNNFYLDGDQIISFLNKVLDNGKLLIPKNAIRNY